MAQPKEKYKINNKNIKEISEENLKKNTKNHSKIFYLNRFLAFMVFCTMIFSFVMYSFVVDKQKQIDAIHQSTKAINSENIELQARLDYLRSFDNINAKILQSGTLGEPSKIIEVNDNKPNVEKTHLKKITKINSAIGY